MCWVMQAERLVARSAAAEADAAGLRRQLGLAREASMAMSQRSSALVRTANGLARPCCNPRAILKPNAAYGAGSCQAFCKLLYAQFGQTVDHAVLRALDLACNTGVHA